MYVLVLKSCHSESFGFLSKHQARRGLARRQVLSASMALVLQIDDDVLKGYSPTSRGIELGPALDLLLLLLFASLGVTGKCRMYQLSLPEGSVSVSGTGSQKGGGTFGPRKAQRSHSFGKLDGFLPGKWGINPGSKPGPYGKPTQKKQPKRRNQDMALNQP